ncbi:hypothetical protein MYX04_05755 [Nitrospiraceae bacterium AH_259_D15_M11_P09]|nr:hypothetical protein [Nitrospiraceae bacterium AH_259_D15_M11_P09]
MKVGDLDIELVTQGKDLRLRIRGRPFGLETLASTADLLSLSRYLVREVEKFPTMNTKEDIP